jgi:hypothetical protein
MDKEDFTVECNVCGQRYLNHVGSTECCGSIAYVVEDDKKTKDFILYKLKDNED